MKNIIIINLIPHPLNMVTEDGDFTIESSGKARAATNRKHISEF